MLKKLALLVALAYGSVLAQQTAGTTEPSGLVPGTIYNTGNIVQPVVSGSNTSPWTNGVYQPYLQCMYSGQQGNCGPNPSVTPLYGNGYVVFSYGLTDLYQVQSIASVLPNTGLRVNGYNFGFTAKNGSGWDDGRVDQLNAYVAFYGTDGKVKDYTNYDLNSKFNWTRFDYTKDFVTPYAASDLSTVRYGFVGRDNNFWAGNYGPELMDFNFSLKYSVDPCGKDPLYSPTCPGYMEALNKLLPPATVVSDPVATVAIPATVVTEPVVATTTTATASSTVSTGQPSIVASVVSAPAPTTSSTSSSTSTSSTSQSKETTSSGGSTSLALSIISKNSERDAAGSAVAQSAVAQAQQAATQAQQEAASVAASAVANSTTMNAATVGSQQSTGTGIRINNNNSSNTTNFSLQSNVNNIAISTSGPQSTNNNTTIVQQQNSSGLGLNVSNNQPVIVVNTNTQQNTVSETVTTFALPLLQPQQPVVSIVAPSVFGSTDQTQVQQQTSLQNNNVTMQSIESYAVVPQNFLTDKSNPLTDIVEGKNTVTQNNTIATTGSSVNRNSSDNEVAGGVDLNKMALAPAGYSDYLSLTLRDAAFYAPKEVYRNQRNVDNARLLRLLTNDSKHKEMVEQQYKGN